MKKRLVTGMLAVALAIGGVGAGVTAGKFVPAAGQLFGATTIKAASMSIEAAAPLAPLTPSGSGFTYQGRLKDGTTPANGQYDFQFTLYDALTGGSLVAGPISQANQTVSEGLFTVILDFGATAFNGDARYLEISVRPTGGGGYITLSPRQPITPTPYALFALKTKGYKNVVTVAQDGGDFSSVQAALNSITTNSSANKYLVWVGPGTYTEQVTMKQYVDIEGSGELTTRITFSGFTSTNTGTVVGASNAELRSLTVENTGGNNYATAIYNSGASPSLLHVTATASGGTSSTYGVLDNNSSPSMNNVTATAFGGFTSFGLSNVSSSPTIRNSNISAIGGTNGNYGVYNLGSGTVTIDNSKIAGSTNSINNISGVTTVGASELSGGPVSNGGTLTCTASYTPNGTATEPLNINCTAKQMIKNVVTVGQSGADFTTITAALNYITDNSSTNKYLVKVGPGVYTERVTMKQWVDIEGSGEKTTRITFTGSPGANTGTVVGASNAELRSLTVENTGGNNYAIAIYNSGASPSLLHITATASGGDSVGVENVNNSSPSMTNMTATASGGNSNSGVDNRTSSPSMNNVTATASGAGSQNNGVTNVNSSASMTNVTATASGSDFNVGIYDFNSGSDTVTIDNSKIAGSSYSIINTDGVTTVGASQLSGGPVNGSVTCAGVYDENYVFYPSTCP